MNSVRLKFASNTFKLVYNALKLSKYIPVCQFTSAVDVMDSMSAETYPVYKNSPTFLTPNVMHFKTTDNESFNFTMSTDDINSLLLQLMSRNKDKRIEQIVQEHYDNRKFIDEATLKQLFRHYSLNGKPGMVGVLQKYCAKVDPNLYKRNVEFLHYMAKAQCMRGNSEKGLSILKECYKKYENRRTFYRILFKELIQDSVLNRSEASLVIFKKYVLEFSKLWDEHYPLICFWYTCWTSTWFSDQMLSNELLESSGALLEIVSDKATTFSITVLRDYNEDAVVRLLQILLKYDKMTDYAKVLQILFNYKLRNRDVRGCTEIIRNCKALGITLPSDQQGKYIKMLIEGGRPDDKPISTKTPPTDFKLKF